MANDRKRDAWTLLTSHGHVLVEIARNPTARIRDISAAAGITERAALAIIADLDAAGYVTRSRVGRRNHYAVHLDLPFRHPAQHDLLVGPFLRLLAELPGESATPPVARGAATATATKVATVAKVTKITRVAKVAKVSKATKVTKTAAAVRAVKK